MVLELFIPYFSFVPSSLSFPWQNHHHFVIFFTFFHSFFLFFFLSFIIFRDLGFQFNLWLTSNMLLHDQCKRDAISKQFHIPPCKMAFNHCIICFHFSFFFVFLCLSRSLSCSFFPAHSLSFSRPIIHIFPEQFPFNHYALHSLFIFRNSVACAPSI